MKPSPPHWTPRSEPPPALRGVKRHDDQKRDRREGDPLEPGHEVERFALLHDIVEDRREEHCPHHQERDAKLVRREGVSGEHESDGDHQQERCVALDDLLDDLLVVAVVRPDPLPESPLRVGDIPCHLQHPDQTDGEQDADQEEVDLVVPAEFGDHIRDHERHHGADPEQRHQVLHLHALQGVAHALDLEPFHLASPSSSSDPSIVDVYQEGTFPISHQTSHCQEIILL